mmetsp:Transcript_95455/g.285017  ORF Transcript_95455/g.285017 Transcript_95455/m.285017 type:complete len:209 (+) Transcript_95455:23-649(+)
MSSLVCLPACPRRPLVHCTPYAVCGARSLHGELRVESLDQDVGYVFYLLAAGGVPHAGVGLEAGLGPAGLQDLVALATPLGGDGGVVLAVEPVDAWQPLESLGQRGRDEGAQHEHRAHTGRGPQRRGKDYSPALREAGKDHALLRNAVFQLPVNQGVHVVRAFCQARRVHVEQIELQGVDVEPTWHRHAHVHGDRLRRGRREEEPRAR